jgi:hypothetical protein
MQNTAGINAAIAVALISAAVSLVTAAVTAWSARLERQNTREKILVERRSALEKIQLDIQSLRWAQHSQAYPKLWSVIQKNTSDWRTEGKDANAAWAKDFLRELNACHADWGVLFSQAAYERFFELRGALIQVVDKGLPTAEDLFSLDVLWSGTHQRPGLATVLKDELDSYQPVAWPKAAVVNG